MDPQDAANRIKNAIKTLESGRKDDAAKEAYEFLQKVPFDYAVAIEEFRSALANPSFDVRMHAASNLARLGAELEWVVPVLHAAFIVERNELIRMQIAHALGGIKTQAAAKVITTLFEEELRRDPHSLVLESLSRAASRIGAIGIAELGRLGHIIDTLSESPDEHDELIKSMRRSLEEIAQTAKEAYHCFVREEGGAKAEYPVLGRSLTSLCAHGPKMGAYTVVFDGRVHFVCGEAPAEGSIDSGSGASLNRISPEQRKEVRCVVLQGEPGQLICLAVADHFSCLDLEQTFPDFMRWFVDSFQPQRLQFGIVDPVATVGSSGRFIKVDAYYDTDNSQYRVRNLVHDQDLAALLKVDTQEDGAALKQLIAAQPKILPGFLEFVGGRNHDERMRSRFAERFHSSEHGQLDYSGLASDFCEQVKQLISSSRPEQPTECPTICADSFDAPKHSDFFAQALPEPIRDLVLDCQAIVAQWRADPEEVNRRDEAFLGWPSLENIPAQYRVKERRPFEIEIPENTGQVLLNLDPRQYGFVAFRCKQDDCFYEVTNIPSSVCTAVASFSWHQLGSYALALNILNAFVPPRFDGQEAVECRLAQRGLPYRTFASKTAHQLAADFAAEILQKIPVWGGVVSPDRIRAWIIGKLDDRASNRSQK